VAREKSQVMLGSMAAATGAVVAGGVFWYLQLWKFLH